MGDGRIFLKRLRDTFFNKELWNVPNLGLIHLAGHQIFPVKKKLFSAKNLSKLYIFVVKIKSSFLPKIFLLLRYVSC
jgi:hypothetical protein